MRPPTFRDVLASCRPDWNDYIAGLRAEMVDLSHRRRQLNKYGRRRLAYLQERLRGHKETAAGQERAA